MAGMRRLLSNAPFPAQGLLVRTTKQQRWKVRKDIGSSPLLIPLGQLRPGKVMRGRPLGTEPMLDGTPAS